MRNLFFVALATTLSCGVSAQDRVTLTNNDVLTGTIKSMADGTLIIESPVFGETKVPMSSVKDLVTEAMIELQTKTAETTLKRRVLGIEGGNLRLEGEAPNTLALDTLGKINPPAYVEPSWTGSIKLNALWVEGNTDARSVGAAFDASLRRTADRLTVDAAWDYSEDKDNDTTSPTFREWTLSQRRAGAGIKYDYYLTKKWYAYVNSRVLGDTLADLQLRYSGGAGIGYTWVETSETTFVTEVGLSYVNENYRSAQPSTDYLSARCAYKLTHAFSKDTKLTHGVEAYPSVEDADDIYLQAKTEIVTSLTEAMIASLTWVLDYDNTPSQSTTMAIDRVDNRVYFSLGWSF